MDRGGWRTTVHRVSKSITWLSDLAHTQDHLLVGSNSCVSDSKAHYTTVLPPSVIQHSARR